MNLIPYSRYARTVLNCEKTLFLREFLDEPDTPLTFEWPPGGIVILCVKYRQKLIFT